VAISTGVREQFLERGLREIPSNLRDAAWAYLVDITSPEDLKLLGDWATGTWLESRVKWLQAWIDAGRDLDNFLPTVPDPQLIPEPMKRSMRSSTSLLADESLLAIMSLPVFDLSEAAAAELAGRKAPTGKDRSPPDMRLFGRSLASSLAAAAGVPDSDPDEEKYERLSRENNETLRRTLDWYNPDGSTSYRLLVERGEIAREVVREDLLGRFQRVRDESYQQMERTIGPERAAKHDQEFKDFHGFITRTFTAAALTALATEPTPEDVAISRRFLNDNLARPAALRIIASKGTAEDADDLIDIARSSFGADRRLALEGARTCGQPVHALSAVARPASPPETRAIRVSSRGKPRAPLSEFVQTAPASPDPAPHPIHAAARAYTRAYTDGKRAARSIGRDWISN